MDISDQAEIEIELIGPQVGMTFYTDPIEGVSPQQYFFRSIPSFEALEHTFLLIKDGANAACAVLGVVAALKVILGKRPELTSSLKLRVRIGIRIEEDDVSKLRELGCEVELVREPVERFEAGVVLPTRANAVDDPSNSTD